MTGTDHLAYQRTIWALERTQLAWVRTAFAVMTTGLALDRGTSALQAARLLENSRWVEGANVGGIVLSLAAALQLFVATINYVRRDRELARAYQMPLTHLPAALPISIAVAVLGVVLAVLLARWG